jgi:prevent-host-death family protein
MESTTSAERIPVTEASARGIARLAKDAEAGHPVIITRHGKAVAAVVPISSDPNPGDLTFVNQPPKQRPSATDRWVEAVTGSPRRVIGPPAGA